MIVRENLYWNCTCKIIHACLEMILINRELIIRKLKKKQSIVKLDNFLIFKMTNLWYL